MPNRRMEQDPEEFLRTRVHGQNQVVRLVARALSRADLQLDRPNKPRGTWLFLGPTGVGKTETVKAAAEWLYRADTDWSAHLARFDMAELQSGNALELMLGNGSTSQGRLGDAIDALNSIGGGILLFDEIEKAHEHFRTLFLAALDEGRITMANGRPKSLRWIIVAMTSNLGGEKVMNLGAKTPQKHIQTAMLSEAEAFFRPEGMARFSLKLVFNRLSQSVQLELARRTAVAHAGSLRARLLADMAGRPPLFLFPPDKEIVLLLLKIGFSKLAGARNLKDAIRDQFDDAYVAFVRTHNIDVLSLLAASGKGLRFASAASTPSDIEAGLPPRHVTIEPFDLPSDNGVTHVDALAA